MPDFETRRIAIELESGRVLGISEHAQIIIDGKDAPAGMLPYLWVRGQFIWLVIPQEVRMEEENEIPGVEGGKEEIKMQTLIPIDNIMSIGVEDNGDLNPREWLMKELGEEEETDD